MGAGEMGAGTTGSHGPGFYSDGSGFVTEADLSSIVWRWLVTVRIRIEWVLNFAD